MFPAGSQVGSHSLWTRVDGCGRWWTRKPCAATLLDSCGRWWTGRGDLRVRRPAGSSPSGRAERNPRDGGGSGVLGVQGSSDAWERFYRRRPRNSSVTVGEPDAVPQPVGYPRLVDLAGGDGQHRLFSLVDVGRVGLLDATVEIDEHDQGRPSGSLVPVGKWWCQVRRQTSTAALSYRSG